ncbi:MAG TPA: DNA double-strand break repair nuclease NurA, partial [Actinomycetota bacterium]|nr:DNA double-strand break repair nuclease NurA [Actinomycetota bacterium]
VRDTHREAVERGVSLAGVVKASTLFWGRNAPLVTLLKRRGDRELGPVPWAARISTDPTFARLYVGEIFVAHLAPTAPHAFRVDVARGPAAPGEILGRLATVADDPAFVGYPYPLARAHQAARVSGYAVADLRRSFRDALSRHGMGEDDVETLFQDFHEVLNRS